MSKFIRFTAEMLEKAKAEFLEEMRKTKLVNGTINFRKTFDTGNAKATLRFTELAWCKMKALVAENEKEVAWHGVAERCDGNVYLISDILVYPQEVTGATVDMDTERYSKWIQEGITSGDERFAHFYAQGHSHVNMAVSPSGTDLDHQKEILSMVRDTGFYIFMIWNKKNERNIWIYDIGKNILFENADITVEILEQENGVVQFLRDAADIVKTHVYVTQFGSAYRGGGYYGGTGAPYGKPASNPGAVTPVITGKTADKKPKVTAHVDRKSTFEGSGYDDDDPSSPYYYNERYTGNLYGME